MSSESTKDSEESERPKRAHSEATKEKQRLSSLAQGEKRRAEIQGRILVVQKKIEADRAERAAASAGANDAAAPPQRLEYAPISRAQVLREAGVNETTLLNNEKYGPFLASLTAWLDAINFKPSADEQAEQLAAGGGALTLKERVEAWKDLYGRLAQSHRDTELELQDTKAVLQKQGVKVAELSAEVFKLSTALQSASGKVVSLPAK